MLFSLPLLKGEVNPVDLMLIEGIRIFYPKVYNIIREKPELFLGSLRFALDDPTIKDHRAELLKKAFEGLDDDEKESVEILLKHLFPHFNKSGLELSISSQYSDDIMIGEQRIGTRRYFDRYFSYTVSDDDIPDTELEDFIERIESDVNLDIPKEIERIVNNRNSDLFVLKLRKKTESLSQDMSCNLAIAIAKVAAIFPQPEIGIKYATAFNQALLLVNQLVKNISANNRFSVSEDIITEGSIFFATGFFDRIRTTKEIIERDIIFTAEEEYELGTILKERIKHFLDNINICTQFPRDAAIFLAIWSSYGSKEETNQYITKTSDDDPYNALELLKCHTITMYSGSHSHKGDFEQKNYESIAKVVDADIISDALNKIYGSNIEKLKNNDNGFQSDADKIAYQFAQIHASMTYTA